MAYTKYSLTPANNNAAPPDGAPEGMLPSAVNDTMRDMMAQIRDVGDGIRGGTYTMTAPVITGGSITGVALSGNTLTNPVITGGSINNTTVGATTRSTGAFTTLASNGATTFTAGTASTSTTTGTAVITGGLGVSGRINAANFDGIVGANTAAAGNFTTLGATGVATFSAGTVSAPAITTTGDTNTGIFFPAADTIAFTEGGVESMRIDSSGNLGLGTASPASTSGRNLTIGSAEPSLVLNSSSGRSFSIASGGNFQYTVSSLVFYDNTASATRMLIDSTGNVGIGTTAPSVGSNAGTLSIQTGQNYGISIYRASTNPAQIAFVDTNNSCAVGTNGSNSMVFFNNSRTTERMRIDSAGNVGIGTSSPQADTAVTTLQISGDLVGRLLVTGTRTNTVTGQFTGNTFNDTVVAGSVTNHPLVFTTNDTERMRLDSSGNLGLGVTPSAWASGYNAFQFGASGRSSALFTNGVNNNWYVSNSFFDGTNFKYVATGASTAYSQFNGTHTWKYVASGTAGNNITYTDAMTLDASGNLGIGTTSPRNAGAGYQGITLNGTSSGFLDINENGTRVYTAFGLSNNIWHSNPTATGSFIIATNNSERMRIDSSGNVLVGTTSTTNFVDRMRVIGDTNGVDLGGTSTTGAIRLRGSDTGAGLVDFTKLSQNPSSSPFYQGRIFYDFTSNFMWFGTNSAERVRINSSGSLSVGTNTSAYETGERLSVAAATNNSGIGISLGNWNNIGLGIYNGYTATGTATAIQFKDHNSVIRGSITVTTSATAYNTSSDYRLKENIAPMTGALGVVQQLKPVTYNWKADGSNGQGFIAHELQAVVPDCVTGEKDAVDAEGNPVYQGIDTSFLVATLTAAIQELKAEFDAYKATHP